MRTPSPSWVGDQLAAELDRPRPLARARAARRPCRRRSPPRAPCSPEIWQRSSALVERLPGARVVAGGLEHGPESLVGVGGLGRQPVLEREREALLDQLAARPRTRRAWRARRPPPPAPATAGRARPAARASSPARRLSSSDAPWRPANWRKSAAARRSAGRLAELAARGERVGGRASATRSRRPGRPAGRRRGRVGAARSASARPSSARLAERGDLAPAPRRVGELARQLGPGPVALERRQPLLDLLVLGPELERAPGHAGGVAVGVHRLELVRAPRSSSRRARSSSWAPSQ